LRGKRIRGSQREEDHGTDREKAPSKASVIGFEIKTARANESMYGASFEKKNLPSIVPNYLRTQSRFLQSVKVVSSSW
jgi:hypothetical protein